MRHLLANIGINLCALACIGIAGYLAIKGNNEAWGWFLFVGLLCAGSVTLKEKQ